MKSTAITICSMVLACVVFLSCGNLFHDLTGIQDKPVEPVLPKVEYTYPADKATDVETDKSIIASFNKEMNSSSINNNTFIIKKIETVTSNGQITTVETVTDGDISVINNNTIIFKVKNSGKMKEFCNYAVFISKDIKDKENQNLTDNYQWSFKTKDKEDKTGPEVISSEPNQYIYQTENVLISAKFSEDINPISLSNISFILKKIENDAEINIPGTVSYDSKSKTAFFISSNPLEISASYKARIESPLEDLSGNKVIPYHWDFRHLKTYNLPCEILELNLDCCEACK